MGNHDTEKVRAALADQLTVLWEKVSWHTPREEADRVRRQAIQSCHAWHRAANPAYRQRCEREGIGDHIDPAQLPAVAFPEEIYKAYAEKQRADGQKLGVFCERNVPLLLEHLNHYITRPITMDGLQPNYMAATNIRGGLDRLRADLLQSQGVFLVTSSGTTGRAISLIPLDQESLALLQRTYGSLFREATMVPGHGPIEPEHHGLVGYSPQKGSMMMALAFEIHARGFAERAILTIPTNVQTRELRWRGGVYAGFSGRVLQWIMRPLQRVGTRRIAAQGMEAMIAALRWVEQQGLRAAVAGNPWMAYNVLKRLESIQQAEVSQGKRRPAEPLIQLAPGSVLVFGGGNKSRLDVAEDEIVALYRRVIGGLDKVVDVYNQSEGYISGIRCEQGNYHLDPHADYFTIDSYLAYFDPRQSYRVPATLTGDLVDGIHDEPCPCGAPTRYFRHIQRDDQKRGSKGCAAALAEYA